jgi:hypothetical protein
VSRTDAREIFARVFPCFGKPAENMEGGDVVASRQGQANRTLASRAKVSGLTVVASAAFLSRIFLVCAARSITQTLTTRDASFSSAPHDLSRKRLRAMPHHSRLRRTNHHTNACVLCRIVHRTIYDANAFDPHIPANEPIDASCSYSRLGLVWGK